MYAWYVFIGEKAFCHVFMCVCVCVCVCVCNIVTYTHFYTYIYIHMTPPHDTARYT